MNRPRVLRFVAALATLLPSGAMAHHRLPQMPPAAPASTERRINGNRDPVVERCVQTAQREAYDLNETILKVVVTRSSRWGTIWRADLSLPVGGAPVLFRFVCSKKQTVVRSLDIDSTHRFHHCHSETAVPSKPYVGPEPTIAQLRKQFGCIWVCCGIECQHYAALRATTIGITLFHL